jgi:hypothetical protein
MVFIKRQARIDLDGIVAGLLEWDKITLSVQEVMQYVDDIADACYQLDNAVHRSKAKFESHLKYGAYSYSYKRNKFTTWYIIYDVDSHNDVYVNKILSNYQTIS